MAADPITSTWWISSPLVLIFILGFYLGFHLLYEPDEEAQYSEFLRFCSFLKNVMLVIMNMLEFILFANHFRNVNFNFFCEPVPYLSQRNTANWDQEVMTVRELVAAFYLIKTLECLDTILLKIRGTDYIWLAGHHATMLMICYFALRYVPGGTAAFLASINAFFHSLVYASAATSYLEPRAVPYHPQFSEALNNIQFFALIIFAATPLYKGCGFPTFSSLIVIVYVVFLAIGWKCQ